MRHLLSGASSGIGSVLARTLADRGDELVLLARNEDRSAQLARDFPAARVVVADLAEPGTLNGLGREVDEPLDSVVHAAGVVELGAIERLRLRDWEETLAVNLLAPAVLTRELLPQLRESGGTVVFVNSGAGLTAHADWSAYAASKHGLRALADSLRAEEQSRGVRVTTVYPGRTATPMQAKVHDQEGKEYQAGDWIDPQTVADAIVHVLDLPGDATISDLTIRPR